MADDIRVAVRASQFEVPVVGRQPRVDNLGNGDATVLEDQRARRLLAAVAPVALDANGEKPLIGHGLTITPRMCDTSKSHPTGWLQRRRPLRFKSNAPALALFVLGAFLLIYPVMQLKDLNRYIEVDTVPVKGLVHGDVYPVLVYAVRRGDTLNKNGEFKLPVSFRAARTWMTTGFCSSPTDASSTSGKEWGKEIEVLFTPIIFEPANYQGLVAP